MTIQRYRLQLDPDGWRLQKYGSAHAESIFSSKEDALRLLPEAVEQGGAVSIHNATGQFETTIVIK